MITDQDQKFKTVLTELSDTLSEQAFFNAFLKKYPEDWKQLKVTYSKFKRSKQFGKTIPLPRPEEALRRTIRIWLKTTKKNA